MATKKYMVKLTPHDKFFFGGEKNFGQKDNEKSNTNYLVKSNYFPQQTGVLGFVRHQLLLQCNNDGIFKDNKISSKKNAGELIGYKSFRVNDVFDFGEIQSISPVFLCNNKEQDSEDFYFPANRELQYNKESKSYDFLQIKKSGTSYLLDNYDPKVGLADLYVNKDNDYKTNQDIFKEVQQVGIRKKYEGGTR